ncbi:MAG: DUF4406 domain-containing protein [Cyanobacteria bacterium P01_D01_bin.36]
MLVYVAGPYRAKNGRSVQDNIDAAEQVAIALWDAGHYALCPHLNTAHFEEKIDSVSNSMFLAGTLEMLRRCDAIVMVKNWGESEGALTELNHAKSVGMPIYHAPELPPPSLTEKRCPGQCKAFIDTVMSMYRLHLSKNADYSPMNVLGAGEIGLATRLWDKIARLMNLYGFNIEIASSSHEPPRSPKHESIDDTLIDAAVYSVIGILLRQGKWGK